MNQKVLFEAKKFVEINKRKNLKKFLPTSFLFTDRKKIADFENSIKLLPKNSAIIIREYDLEKKDREIFAKKISQIAKKNKLKTIIGKDVELARKINADGVHFSDFDKNNLQFLQQKKFKKKFLFSFSCHNFKSILKIKKLKPDIVFISPVFPSISHLNKRNLGIKNLAKIYLKSRNNNSQLNLFALGGINSKNLSSVRKLGLSGFAAISLFSNNL